MIKAKQEFFGFEPITNSLYVLHIYTKPIDEKTEPCLLCDDLIIHEDNSQRNYIREIFFSLKNYQRSLIFLLELLQFYALFHFYIGNKHISKRE